jgi:hypothetical protein
MKKQVPFLYFALSLFFCGVFSSTYSQVKDSTQSAATAMQTAPQVADTSRTEIVPTTSNIPTTNTGPTASSTNNTNSSDLVYRVQLVVIGDKSHLSSFLKHYKITEQPSFEPAEETPARVMIGNYTDYNSAKTCCDALINKGLKDAFVAPYYMGKRVTLAEAASHTQH